VAVSGKVYFVADAHLGANAAVETSTVPALLRVLDEVKQEQSTLFILGDLYDFWFEFRRSVTNIYPVVLDKLRELAAAGCHMGFAGGNHDFWMLDFLRRELGAEVSDGWIERDIQGKKVCMAHGDGLRSGDNGYKILKKILRSRVNIALYRLLPAGIGVPLALAFSRASRKTSVSEMNRIADKLFREVALKKFEEGFDVVILGHVHMPYERAQGEKRFLIVGDWIEDLSYLVMEGGRVTRRSGKPA